MKYKYGELDGNQIKLHKESLRKSIFWLILYVDPKTKSQFTHVNVEQYFDSLMLQINGLNKLFYEPQEIITLLSLLEAALIEYKKDAFSFKTYRKLILDAGSVVTKIKECD